MNNVLTSIFFALNHIFLIQSGAEFVFIGFAIPSVSRSNAREFANLGSHSVKIEKIEFSLSEEDNITSYQGTIVQTNRYVRIALKYSVIERVKPREPNVNVFISKIHLSDQPYFKNEYFVEFIVYV